MENKIFDTHAHYNDEKFKSNMDNILKKVHNEGVANITNVGADLKESLESIELAKKYDFIYSSVGIHPFNVNNLEENWEEKLLSLAKNEKVVAIGEAGLDYSKKDFSKEKQFEVFEKQLNLAEKLNLPAIIHSRDAEEDTLSIIKNFPNVKGVIHCFSGDLKLAEKYIQMGWFIGFTGIVTFKNAEKTKKVAECMPLNNMVVETDCPYMAPEPLRGKVCDSSMLKFIIQKIADIRAVSFNNIMEQTFANALKLYKIEN